MDALEPRSSSHAPTTITGPEIAQMYLDHVYKWFGLPVKVISDCDPQFTSHFGKSLANKLGIQQNLSSAFHPQTDGISERKNQWIEQYLRLMTSTSPENWMHWLAIASAIHNNRRNQTMGLSPNQILLGYETELIPTKESPSNNQLVEDRFKIMIEKRAAAIDAINRTRKGKPVVPSQYRLNDQVWLEATNLKICHQKTKLNPKRYGLFKIIKEISPVAYQLKIPVAWGIHNVFHASLLNPYHETATHGPNFSRPPPDLIEGEEEYQVERIIAHRHFGQSKMLQYLIKWEGYPDSDNTWELAHQVHAPELIWKYHRVVPVTAIKAMDARLQRLCISPPESPLILSSAISSHLPLAVLSSSHTSSTPSNLYASSSSSTKTLRLNSRTLASIPTTAISSIAPITTLKATRCRTTPSPRQTSPAPTLLPAPDRPLLHHQSRLALLPPSSTSIRRTPKPSWISRRVSLPPSTSLRVSKARREWHETCESTNWRLSSSMSASNGHNLERPLRGTSSIMTVAPPTSPSPSKMGITSPLTGSDSSPEDKLLGSLRSILLDPPLSSRRSTPSDTKMMSTIWAPFILSQHG
jgi:Chromo (CHRromatin Organisation MOdifier) domain